MTGPSISPRMRSLHTSALEAIELGTCALASVWTAAWTHPDEKELWNLTEDGHTFDLAKHFNAEPQPGFLVVNRIHGVVGETTGHRTLFAFKTEAFTMEDKAAQGLTSLCADIWKDYKDSSERQRYYLAVREAVGQYSLLFEDDRKVLVDAMALCWEWSKANFAELTFNFPGSFVALPNGRVVLHPLIAWDEPF